MRFLSILTAFVLMLLPSLVSAQISTVEVVRLSVDGRYDQPLDLESRHPSLSWQIVQTADCAEAVCPGDRQTEYEVQVATSEHDLKTAKLRWGPGKQQDSIQSLRIDCELNSRDTLFWRVRVWNALSQPSAWSNTSSWSVGLLHQSDWGETRWIDYPDRNPNQPLPLFTRQLNVPDGKDIVHARLYLSGVGMHLASVNGKAVTDEVLAPGYSNYQLSSEYRTYDIRRLLSTGANAIGVKLGNGPAYVRRSITNPAVGRNAPYAWWQSQLKGDGTLSEAAAIGSISVRLNNATGYHVQGSINIDTSGGGDNLESRVITAIDTVQRIISFSPTLKLTHAAGARVTGSGNNIAASDPSAGAASTSFEFGRTSKDEDLSALSRTSDFDAQ
jgi:alpha-L-rhamnosidase